MGDARRLLSAVWVATAIAVAGQVVDLRWHATHGHFETAADQVEAHWLVWLGEVVLFVLAVVGLRRFPTYRGLVAAAGMLLVVTAVHFVAHALESDPDVIHLLLAAAKVATLGAVLWVTYATVAESDATA